MSTLDRDSLIKDACVVATVIAVESFKAARISPRQDHDSVGGDLIHPVPVLGIGHSDIVDEQKAKEVGIREFLTKPLNMDVLAEAIDRIMSSQENSTSPE